MAKTDNFPGIYPQNDLMRKKKPGLRMSEYFKSLYDGKLDRKDTPNTIYAVDENGRQVMVSLSQFIDIDIDKKIYEILDAHDAPADNKQYARENKKWEEVELHKVKLVDVLVKKDQWVTEEGSSEYPYEYRIYDERITSTMVPEVTFSESDSLDGNFSPICESFDGYVSIYAQYIPETDIVVPLVTLQ